MNQTLTNHARQTLKDLLAQCTEAQQLIFKRMYSHKDLDKSINDVVDEMPEDKLDWATTQCERTVENNKKKEVK